MGGQMKKSLKKLKLSRETVRQLNGPGLRWAAGGVILTIGDCPNDTTQTSGNCPSGFCGTVTCGDYCGSDTSIGANACICDSAKTC
jgi:hypothetical protein